MQTVSLNQLKKEGATILVEQWTMNAIFVDHEKNIHHDSHAAYYTFDRINKELIKELYFARGRVHRDASKGPAVIEYLGVKENKIVSELYYEHGKVSNPYGPAIINYDHNGVINKKAFMLNDQLHNTEGPALLLYHKGRLIEEQWQVFGCPIQGEALKKYRQQVQEEEEKLRRVANGSKSLKDKLNWKKCWL